MAGLSETRPWRPGRVPASGAALLAAAALSLAAAGCQESLPIKDYVQQKVDDSQSMLRITAEDGSAIRSGDTARWPATIFQVSSSKTFRLTNHGDSNVTLTGTSPVGINGGAGQAAFANGLTQPITLTLPPGGSTAFSVFFTPSEPDKDYVCDLVVNSDDPKNPAYTIHAYGRSTQWHGSTTVATSTTDILHSPQIAIDGESAITTFSQENLIRIGIKASTDGGRNWQDSFTAGSPSPGSSPHLLAVTGAGAGENLKGPHVLYYDGSWVAYCKYLNGSWSESLLSRFATAGPMDGRSIYGDLLLSGYVFIAWYDTAAANPGLFYNYSSDPRYIPTPGNIDTSFMATPKQLTGGSTARIGGEYHSMQRDSRGNLYLAYIAQDGESDDRIRILRASFDDLGFGSSTVESAGPASPDSGGIAIALTESAGVATVHVVYCQGNAGDLYHTSTSSADDLNEWRAPARIGDQDSFGRNFRLMTDDAGILYVLHQSHGGSAGIVLSSSADSGATWSHLALDEDASLGAGSFRSHVALALSGRDVYAAYTTDGQTTNRHPNGYSVTLKKSIDGGATW